MLNMNNVTYFLCHKKTNIGYKYPMSATLFIRVTTKLFQEKIPPLNIHFIQVVLE